MPEGVLFHDLVVAFSKKKSYFAKKSEFWNAIMGFEGNILTIFHQLSPNMWKLALKNASEGRWIYLLTP